MTSFSKYSPAKDNYGLMGSVPFFSKLYLTENFFFSSLVYCTSPNFSTVEARAEIVGPTLKYLTPGSTLKLICKVLQSTEATAYIFWYHDNRMINYDLDRGINVSSEAGKLKHFRINDFLIELGKTTCLKIQFTCAYRLPLQRAYNSPHDKKSFWKLYVRSIERGSSFGCCSYFQR